MNWRQELRDAIMKYFGDSDIKSLCFDLGVDYEELSGDNKTEKVINLIEYFSRQNAIPTLIAYCSQSRPNVPWNEIEKAAAQENISWRHGLSQNVSGQVLTQRSFPWFIIAAVFFVMIALIGMFVVFLNMTSITIEPRVEITRIGTPLPIEVLEPTATTEPVATTTVEPMATAEPSAATTVEPTATEEPTVTATIKPTATDKPTTRPPTVTHTPPSPTPLVIPTPAELILFTRTDEGVAKVSPGGEIQIISDFSGGYSIDIEGNEIYFPYWNGDGKVHVLNLEGDEIRSIPIPDDVGAHDIAVLPDKRIALMDNANDKIHIIDPNGTLLATVNIHETGDNHLQNLDGVVVANRLIFSEDGNKQLLQIDLNTYEVSTFRDLSSLEGPWLGQIDYFAGEYFLTTPQTIYRFTETGSLDEVASLPDGNITGLVVTDNYAYATVNFTGQIYRINLIDGTAEVFVSDLNYPQDLDFVPNR